ncbi:hypothetical protein CKO40_04845 [Halochromatium glycolicum]|uniref:Uncharacterized protein n=2 Tax=Halochromatium glycolicum TaxID=85075 RepID=A0AAJ0U250_9GAMM|nr:DUF6516 family protein [Halochromatium glycolicum]MBK1703889.1 hypothetical protein [Halochromatium glycolicum]
MPAKAVYRKKEQFANGLLIEVVIWQLSEPMPGCAHPFKYRLYAGHDGNCIVRYDNERGKGDHKHICDTEVAYQFVGIDQLLADFIRDLDDWEAQHGKGDCRHQ